jgi:arylformamidase
MAEELRDTALVGIDDVSVGDVDAHVALLAGGIGVIEGLDLRDVDPGACSLIARPVKIARCDGAPARAVQLRQQG